LAQDTPLVKVEKILLEAWKIPKPRFIVSIIGGAKYFKLSEQLETNFIKGIVDIAQKSGMKLDNFSLLLYSIIYFLRCLVIYKWI